MVEIVLLKSGGTENGHSKTVAKSLLLGYGQYH
jgi:hypothetical protein